jgi:hypothetical protein
VFDNTVKCVSIKKNKKNINLKFLNKNILKKSIELYPKSEKCEILSIPHD